MFHEHMIVPFIDNRFFLHIDSCISFIDIFKIFFIFEMEMPRDETILGIEFFFTDTLLTVLECPDID
jgi:hypothetical protein